MNKRSFDLILIGGGTASLSAISQALDLGVGSIALIEKRGELGGECVLNACIPTKTMLSASRLMKRITEDAPAFGIKVEGLSFDFQTLRQREDAVVQSKLAASAIQDERVTVFHGEASFISKRELRVNGQVIRGEKIIIATGSQPDVPIIQGLEDAGYLSFIEATHLESFPKSMVVIGGGPTGVEFAQLFHGLGCQVTLLEKNQRLLPYEEPEIANTVAAILRQDGIQVLTDCDIMRVYAINNEKIVDFQVQCIEQAVQAEEILVATGMKPRVEGLQLENAGIRVEERGIVVNDELQTSCENVWAIGDVIQSYRFTHVADYEASLAVCNAVQNTHRKTDYHAVPWAIYTEPAVAHVGLTEAQAREQFPNVVVLRAPVDSTSGFRVEESHLQGFIKLIVDGETNQLLGGHLLSPGADDIAQTLVLAIQHRMTVDQLLGIMYIFPAKAQIIQKALETYPAEKAKAFTRRVQAR